MTRFLLSFILASVVSMAAVDSLKCMNGLDIGNFIQASQKDGCASCIKFGFTSAYTYACSPLSCAIINPLSKIGIECCTDKDLCNSASRVRSAVGINTVLLLIAGYIGCRSVIITFKRLVVIDDVKEETPISLAVDCESQIRLQHVPSDQVTHRRTSVNHGSPDNCHPRVPLAAGDEAGSKVYEKDTVASYRLFIAANVSEDVARARMKKKTQAI
ncbi:hypothetical protein LSH36_743g01036 [Paralvinella palmiformis]|uniref:Uncharacterized protein n=1 Tax=Paralvinella palmiformis TaxID=53620 RepID=A0AAD9J1G6_9ANNE|nr:hypothetical protein LSH36_743g01036 [Paralvinella palmiformis]